MKIKTPIGQRNEHQRNDALFDHQGNPRSFILKITSLYRFSQRSLLVSQKKISNCPKIIRNIIKNVYTQIIITNKTDSNVVF